MEENIDLGYLVNSIVWKLIVLIAMFIFVSKLKLFKYPNISLLKLFTEEKYECLISEDKLDDSSIMMTLLFYLWLSMLFEYLGTGLYFLYLYF